VNEKKCVYGLGVRVIVAVQEDVMDINVQEKTEIRLGGTEGPNKTVRSEVKVQTQPHHFIAVV
jgi:hypothetical protein